MNHPKSGDVQGQLIFTGNLIHSTDARGAHVWKYEAKCSCGGIIAIWRSAWLKGLPLRCFNCRPMAHNKRHNETNTRLYAIWANMRARCICSSNKAYTFYGARGICVDPSWELYETFRDWANANGYASTLTIDRINPDLGYTPGNCRWIKAEDNIRRRRKVRCLETNEVFDSAWQLAKILNCHDQTVRIICRNGTTLQGKHYRYEN